MRVCFTYAQQNYIQMYVWFYQMISTYYYTLHVEFLVSFFYCFWFQTVVIGVHMIVRMVVSVTLAENVSVRLVTMATSVS